MSYKSYSFYYYIFKYIVNLHESINTKVNVKIISFMLDFEKLVRNA